MTREDYTQEVIKRYPTLDILINDVTSFNHVDLVYTASRFLFMDQDIESDLAVETRRLLFRLRDVGMLEWTE